MTLYVHISLIFKKFYLNTKIKIKGKLRWKNNYWCPFIDELSYSNSNNFKWNYQFQEREKVKNVGKLRIHHRDSCSEKCICHENLLFN